MHKFNILAQFSNEDFANQWFTEIKWPRGKIKCPECNSQKIKSFNHPSMPYRCGICRKPISLKFGTKMHKSSAPLHIWTAVVAHDLILPTGTTVTNLSQELKTNQNTIRSLLNQIRKELVDDGYPIEFETGKLFRLNTIHYNVQESGKPTVKNDSNKQCGSTEMVVVCITEFNSDKIWVETLPKEKIGTIKLTIEKMLPEGAMIFADQDLYDQGFIPEKFSFHIKSGYDDMEEARLKKLGQNSGNYLMGANVELESGIEKAYHRMTKEKLTNYVNEFAGRWNLRHLPLEKQMKIIFTKLARK